MLASNAHVKIGSVEYLLDESIVRRPYNYRRVPLYDDQTVIPGGQGARSLRRDRLLWMPGDRGDWSGGEGNRVWYPDEPTKYDFSDGLNPRISGQLTGRPARESDSLTVTDGTKRVYLTIGDGSLWALGSIEVFESTNGTSWTARTSALVAGTANRITAATGDDNYVYYAAWDSASSGTRIMYRMTAGGTETNVEASGTSRKPFMGLAVVSNKLFAWTGRKFFEYDLNQTLPLTGTKLWDTGVDLSPDAGASSWWADVVEGENSVFFFVGSDGITKVYEARANSDNKFIAAPLWTLPYGFTGKSMRLQNGVLYVAGHWGTENISGRGAMYALPMDTLREVFVGWFRKQQDVNLQMQEMGNSYGYQILVAGASTGRVFVYDAEYDAISMLDDIDANFTDNDDKIGALITYGDRRFAAAYRPGTAGTAFRVHSWKDDEPANRESSGSLSTVLTQGEWDFGFPLETKMLAGFYVTFLPLIANQRIKVEYQKDQDGTWTQAGSTITSATTGNATGRVFLQVSDATTTVDFYRLKWRITLDNNATTTVKQPIVYNVVPEARLTAYEEVWDLVVRIKDESSRTRPSSRKHLAEQQRDNLRTLSANRDIVTFLDGYTSRQQAEKKTHTVYVEVIEDNVGRNAEGSMTVRLRGIPT